MSSHEGKILFDDQYEYLGVDSRGMYVFRHKEYGDIIHLKKLPRFKRKGTNQAIHVDPAVVYYYLDM